MWNFGQFLSFLDRSGLAERRRFLATQTVPVTLTWPVAQDSDGRGFTPDLQEGQETKWNSRVASCSLRLTEHDNVEKQATKPTSDIRHARTEAQQRCLLQSMEPSALRDPSKRGSERLAQRAHASKSRRLRVDCNDTSAESFVQG